VPKYSAQRDAGRIVDASEITTAASPARPPSEAAGHNAGDRTAEAVVDHLRRTGFAFTGGVPEVGILPRVAFLFDPIERPPQDETGNLAAHRQAIRQGGRVNRTKTGAELQRTGLVHSQPDDDDVVRMADEYLPREIHTATLVANAGDSVGEIEFAPVVLDGRCA